MQRQTAINFDRLPDDCGRLLNGISPQDLYRVVHQIQHLEFPGVFDHEMEMAHLPDRGYVSFAPSWHFRPNSPLFTKELIQSLRDGGSMLSIGAGQAYTELLLTKRFGVDPKNITLVDVKEAELPSVFESMRFDMHKEWPAFPQRFKHVIFPESVFINLVYDHAPKLVGGKLVDPIREMGLFKLATDALKVIELGGEIRLLCPGLPKEIVEAVATRLDLNPEVSQVSSLGLNDRLLVITRVLSI